MGAADDRDLKVLLERLDHFHCPQRCATDEKAVGRRLAEIPGVQEVHYITGEDSFLIKIRVADNRELGRFIRDEIASINAVVSTRTSVVLSTYKETAKIPIDE